MTVRELKSALENLPDEMDVFIGERLTEFEFGLVNSAKVIEVGFMESIGDEPLCYEDVLVLKED